MNGYSDRINHALAFAAKHHDQQVRKGTRLPYVTHAANVAIILTRYAQDESTVVAGILHDMVEDCVRDGWTPAMLESRIAEKFGADILTTSLAVTKRRLDDDGNELDREQRQDDFLSRLAHAEAPARWVCAAVRLHDGNALLADLRRTMDPSSVWGRAVGGQEVTVAMYRVVYERLAGVGFDAPIMTEFRTMVEELETIR